MKTSDVSGFRNRSEAAYGVLALEFIADQLHQQSNGGILDAVSIIEMHDDADVIWSHEPLDWILFNKILDRQKSQPRSHGIYLNALQTASRLIYKDVQAVVDIDQDDLPCFAIIFISDGRPSDKEPHHITERKLVLKELADHLKSNFSLHAIGLGRPGAEFSALNDLMSIVQLHGGQGTFSLSQLCCVQLSTALSSISTSLTSSRTETLFVDKMRTSKQTKNIQLRSRHLPTIEQKYRREELLSVGRFQYDDQIFKSHSGKFPWRRLNFKNKTACAFEVEIEPFGKGAERLAFLFYEIDQDGKKVGKAMVAKESISIDNEEKKLKFHESFCRVQTESNELAKKFNLHVKKHPILMPAEESLEIPKIEFLDCFVYEYLDSTSEQVCGFLVEELLPGKFVKYNSNNGFVNRNKSERTIALNIGEVHMTDFIQAFSHWVYYYTNQKKLLCDLQGVLNEEGKHQSINLRIYAFVRDKKKVECSMESRMLESALSNCFEKRTIVIKSAKDLGYHSSG